jgi:Competence protein
VAEKRSLLSVHNGTIALVLAISGQHVAVLSAVLYFALRAFAVPARLRLFVTLAVIWLYILLAGAPPSAIRAGLVAVLEWVARSASAFPFATVRTPGVTPSLVGLFYVGCLPAALCEITFPRERWARWAAVLVLWTVVWLALVRV